MRARWRICWLISRKVNSAFVMLGDGTVLGGTLPDGYHLETALLAPGDHAERPGIRPESEIE